MTHDHIARLKRLSRTLYWFSYALMALLVGAGLYKSFAWLTDATEIAATFPDTVENPHAVSYATRIAVAALGWSTLGLTIYATFALQRMFGLFAKGRVLDTEAALWMRRAGVALFATAVFSIAARTASVLLLSLANAPGARQLAIQLEGNQIFSVFLAGVFMLIAHALVLGAETERENRSFV